MSEPGVESVEREPEVYDGESAVDEGVFFEKARSLAAKLPFVRHAVAMWHALRDDATPLAAKAVIVGAVAYFVLPTDFVPDFVAGFGFTDDAAVLAAALRAIGKYLRPEHYGQADETLGRRR